MAGQQWAISADGGFFANPPLSKELRKASQPMMKFRQYVRPVEGFGKEKGDSIDFDAVTNVQTQGGKIAETAKMPETKFQIVKQSLVVDEFGNSIPYTGKLEALSQFNPTNPIQRAIRDDMAKVFNKEVATEMKKTKTLYIPTGAASGTFDNDGTPSTQATSNMTVFHIKEIVDAMRNGLFGTSTFNTVPAYTGPEGDYIGIFSVKAARGIKDDNEFEEWHKYTSSEKLMTGEIGRVYKTRIIESNHTDALSEKKGLSDVLGQALIFGADPIVEGVAVPEEVRAKVPQDFGRDKAIGWYFLGGWKIVWGFLSTDTLPESHIVLVTSS